MSPSTVAASALQSLRQRSLRTGLSILGLVIGVAALVAILSMIDGMERYARDQVETTTDVQTIAVAPRTAERVDGVTVTRDSVVRMAPADAHALDAALGEAATVVLLQQRAVEARSDTVRTALQLTAASAGVGDWAEVVEGRMFRGDGPELVVSASLAARLAPDASAVGRTVGVDGAEAVVVGVLAGWPDDPHRAAGPFAAFAEAGGPAPTLAIHAARAETVAALTAEIRDWLDGRFPDGRAAFEVASYEARAEQFRRGMLLFKLVMGLITGVSVVVGGVGVMNVLLMTVTERTREIGVRKAVGARRRDVVAQFLAEAVAVSGVGSLIGLGLGLAVGFAAAPVLRAATDVPFYAAVTPQTLAVVAAVAVAVGVVFGTYPALRAARLRPADAIRHE